MSNLTKAGSPRKRPSRPNEGRPKVITEEWQKQIATDMLAWFMEGDEGKRKNIWLKDFARTVISPTTGMPYSWNGLKDACAGCGEFSAALKICDDIQESVLVRLGLTTKSPMPIFALKNVAGWRDKQEIEHSGDGFVLKVEYVK